MINQIVTVGRKVAGEVSKNSPVILTGLAVTGVVATVVLGVRATPKALAIIDDEVYSQYEKSGIMDEVSFPEWLGLDTKTYTWRDRNNMLKKGEIIKLTWKCYIPTAAVGLATIACIIGAHNIHLRRNAALASLYSLTESAFKEYQSKVVETIGKNKELKLRDDVVSDTIKRNPVGDSQVIFTGKGETLFYDQMSGRYFKNDIEKIRKVQNKINKDLISEDFMSLNEFYIEIGLSPIKLGEEMGWHLEHGMLEVRFSAQLTENEEPCIALEYELVPRFVYGD